LGPALPRIAVAVVRPALRAAVAALMMRRPVLLRPARRSLLRWCGLDSTYVGLLSPLLERSIRLAAVCAVRPILTLMTGVSMPVATVFARGSFAWPVLALGCGSLRAVPGGCPAIMAGTGAFLTVAMMGSAFSLTLARLEFGLRPAEAPDLFKLRFSGGFGIGCCAGFSISCRGGLGVRCRLWCGNTGSRRNNHWIADWSLRRYSVRP
jgi:hypothetical protein